MSDMRNWRKAIDEMFSDEIDSGAANRPADGEYEICPACNMEDPDCKECGGEGLIDITGEYAIPDFSKMQMEGRAQDVKIKLKPEDLRDPDDDGMMDRPESEKDVKKHLKMIADRYNVDFVDEFEAYNKPKKVKESDKPYATMDDGPEDYLYKKDSTQKLVGEADPTIQQTRLEVGDVVQFENKGRTYYGVIKKLDSRNAFVQLSHYSQAPPIRINKKRVSNIETNMSESTMDKEMQEMLRLAGMYVKPEVYEAEDNTDGEESPLTNASDSVDAQRGEKSTDRSKFKNKDGQKSVLSEDEQEWIEAVRSAMEYIDAEHEIAYDAASENGQMFDNVKHMSWFIDEVANKIIELGLVGVPPVTDEEPSEFGSFDDMADLEDDFEDDFYVDEGADEVEEDMLIKPKDAPGYDDEEDYEEDYEEECATNEEDVLGGVKDMSRPDLRDKSGDRFTTFEKCRVDIYNEEAYYALADEFGPELDFGFNKNDVIVPCDVESAEEFLVNAGFEADVDFEMVEFVEEDLNNGYRNQRKFDGQDFFPSGETSNVSKDRGPAGAKHGDNPMYTRAKVKENNIYETMRQAYRRHRLK